MPFLSNSVKALKDDSVPDLGQHAAIKGEEHCNVRMGCLALWLQGSIPPVTSTYKLKLNINYIFTIPVKYYAI